MTGILMAGGKSERMGTDKAFVDFKGKKLYEYPLSVLKSSCNEILISSSDKRFVKTGYPVIPDSIENIGPLGGIYTCLGKMQGRSALVLSCDTPCITAEFIDVLIKESGEEDITLAINKDNLPEPLTGIYNKNIRSVIEELIEEKNFKVGMLFKRVKVNYVNPLEWGMDPERLFFNVNRRSDLQKLSDKCNQ